MRDMAKHKEWVRAYRRKRGQPSLKERIEVMAIYRSLKAGTIDIDAFTKRVRDLVQLR